MLNLKDYSFLLNDMNISIDLILRILIGAFLGGAIGLERELRSKGAGFRTHFLVALGSALLAVVSCYGFLAFKRANPEINFDPSRLAAQIVSGIGFIGAGIIIFQKNVVHGLTTAAGLWVASAIGIACGMKCYDLAVVATILVLVVLEATYFFNLRLDRRSMVLSIASADRKQIEDLVSTLESEGVKILSSEIEYHNGEKGQSYKTTMEIGVRKEGYEKRVLELLEGMDVSFILNSK